MDLDGNIRMDMYTVSGFQMRVSIVMGDPQNSLCMENHYGW